MPIDITYDNRETCTVVWPSGCIPYTGYVSATISELLPCRPNVNDVLKTLQNLVDAINIGLGDNKTLTQNCFTFNPMTDSQKVLNQELMDDVCTLQTEVAGLLGDGINPDDILIPIDLLCLQDPACTPQPSYTLTEVLIKLVVNYCSLLDRIVNIETILNI